MAKSPGLRLVESPIPEIQPNECLVHVRATGICGSDVHFWKHGQIGDAVVNNDNGLGHESAGVILKVGKDVTRFQPGDKVAIECGIPCSKATCYHCRTGQYNACPESVFFSTPPHNGTLRRYHAHPEAWLHPIPDNVSFEEGALLEPLTVALAGIDRAGLCLGDSLVICGAGPIGLVTLLAANAAGAEPIVITDLDESRLAKAKDLVPRVKAVQTSRDETAKDLGERIVQTLGQEAKLVLECTGVESSIHAGIYSTRFGGSVFVIGVGKTFQTIPFMHLSFREIDLRFQFRYHDIYPKAISLVAAGIIDMKPLVSHRFALEDGVKAFEAASNPASGAIKVQILDC
ncbi:chaperonin 10-like protein [Aspergillus avenaceus]|uniref:D-xylulose reductase n=1 Tax=Aspergillus avenaceus TaxID=36643 RepID=A0A5N6TS95_ASPAV|nr:chaperonin 10-like protein [Aspergillus avenaceus]